MILLPLALMAGGCVQMTRHSNMMIFGTNTVVGIRAGVNATSVPEVAIGYARQEAVVLPLVANVAETPPGTTNLNRLIPCNLNSAIGVDVAQDAADGVGANMPHYAVHPCSLVAVRGNASDSYSVLASFGGNFSATSEKDKPTAKAGVAQYFATGMAAQLLAVNGGAAVVAAGDAAKQSALNDPVTLNELTPSAADITRAGPKVITWQSQRAALAEKVGQTDAADLSQRFDTFEKALQGPKLDLFAQCKTADVCSDLVNGGAYKANFNAGADAFQKAVEAWPVAAAGGN